MDNTVLEKIKNIINCLDELDDYILELPNSQSKTDSLLSDYRHFLKENDFSEKCSYKVAGEIKKLEILRSELKEDNDMVNVFNTYKNRLLSKENRQFLLNELYKKTKEWGKPYRYRVLTEEEVEELKNMPTKKRGRPKKEVEE